MSAGLPPLEFTECVTDSPTFRENLNKHEKELENTNQHIKRLIKEVKDLLDASKQLSNAQRSFASCLEKFTFGCVGGTQTDDEAVICKSLKEFSKLINSIEDERDRMLQTAQNVLVTPLDNFRKTHIGGVKIGKKKFDKQSAKFCQSQERYLNLTNKKQSTVLQEADASLDMAERHFYSASMEYVYLIQEVHERKKFEFVEILLSFMISWLTFYHQGYEVAKDFGPYKCDLLCKIQKTRNNFKDYSSKLKKRMAEIQKQAIEEPLRNTKGRRQGYLFLLEKKAFGVTWNKHFCTYEKENKKFTMVPYNQLTNKLAQQQEELFLTSCTRRMSDSIDKRFCFDIQLENKLGIGDYKSTVTYTLQALSELDRKAWLDIMDGKEPTYICVGKPSNSEERVLDDIGINFVKKCIEVLEQRGLEEQGLYRIVGVTSKVAKLLAMGLDRRKTEKLIHIEDPIEWETKTITSALKSYLRNLHEPIMTYKYHNGFIDAVKNELKHLRVNDIHTLIYRLPKINYEVLELLIKHLSNVASKSDKNLMTVSNLGVCFGPTLLRPEEETVAAIMDLKFYNIVVELLIENVEKIFQSEPETTSSSDKFIDDKIRCNRQPFTCLTRSYYDTTVGSNVSLSLCNVHDPRSIGIYSTVQNDYISSNISQQISPHRKIQRFNNTQSESNIPNLQNYSSTSFRSYEKNSTSSSSESISSNSRGSGNITINDRISPKKSKRSNILTTYSKNYKTKGVIRVRTLYACLGENDGELSFEPNQIITNVRSSQEPGWLEGTLNGKTGLIPENYVEMLS